MMFRVIHGLNLFCHQKDKRMYAKPREQSNNRVGGCYQLHCASNYFLSSFTDAFHHSHILLKVK